jgi:hypothetical protein
LATVCFCAAFAALFFALTLTGQPRWVHVFILVVAGAFVFPMLGRMWLGTGRHDRLILNRAGLNYCPSSGESRTLPWETVSELRADVTNASLTVLDTHEEQLLKLRAARLGGPKHLQPATEEILAARSRYLEQSVTAPI